MGFCDDSFAGGGGAAPSSNAYPLHGLDGLGLDPGLRINHLISLHGDGLPWSV